MKKLLGIPCPGCGISHSMMAAFRLDLGKAWFANPAGIGVALLFSFQIVARPFAIALPRVAGFVSSISRYGSNLSVILLLVGGDFVFQVQYHDGACRLSHMDDCR
jgi:hypothetical protein